MSVSAIAYAQSLHIENYMLGFLLKKVFVPPRKQIEINDKVPTKLNK